MPAWSALLPGHYAQASNRGGFVLGNPSWAFANAKHYANLGLIAIAAQYRLSNFKDITPIDAIQDSKDLMFWLRTNADSIKIIDDKIAAAGWSVGAQICITLAIFPNTLQDQKINTSPNALLLTSPGTATGGWFTELLN
jgi:acetyl esterase